MEQLKVSLQKLLDARSEMRQLDKEIPNIYVILWRGGHFVDADNKQLLDVVGHDIMNYQNRGLCFDNS